MSRFSKLSHVLWCCQYHIVWVPKYRYRVLRGSVGELSLCANIRLPTVGDAKFIPRVTQALCI